MRRSGASFKKENSYILLTFYFNKLIIKLTIIGYLFSIYIYLYTHIYPKYSAAKNALLSPHIFIFYGRLNALL